MKPNRIKWRIQLPIAALLLFLLAACAPIQPNFTESSTVPAAPAVAESAAPTADADLFAGDWTGAIQVAGIELPFDLHIALTEREYSASLDIPMQSAFGLPVDNLVIDDGAISFTILEQPQQASFSGALDDAGVISGEFSQAGQVGTFTLARVTASAPDAPAGPSGITSVYTDTTGLWSVPIPTGWTLTEHDGFVTLDVPGEQIAVHLLALPGDDAAAALAEAWQLVAPGFDFEIDQTISPPSGEGIESTLVHTYDTGDQTHIIQAAAQTVNGIQFVSLFDLGLQEVQRRSAQISIIDSGFRILGVDRTNLSGVQPGPLTDEIVAEWEAFIADAMEKFEVPGAAIAVVREGQVIYEKGFGVTDSESGAAIAPDTHMMIGSTGKSLTTMLMGTLVDDGTMTWDTTAQELYPDFAVMDPELSETITMRNLVCACTGVPRRDFEFMFNHDSLTASDVIASLGDFEFFTDFGEAFQYSNQMVATAGFIAGLAAEPEIEEPFAAYANALDERVTDPIGMENTTLSFDEVVARDAYAIPHSYTIFGDVVPIDLETEKMLLPVAPAGSHWSTLDDMTQYMLTQLSTGVAPDGERVISEENLLETRVPQVQISDDATYGLGWMIGDYKGQPVVEHGGNTMGFTSDFSFLPESDLGIVILTNLYASNTFSGAARIRLLELLYDLPSQVEPNVDFLVTQMEEQLLALADEVGTEIDPAVAEGFVGEFSNPVLGDLTMTFENGVLTADFGEFATRIMPHTSSGDGSITYLFADPPLAGLGIRLEVDDAGAPVITIGEGVVEYAFLPVD